MTEKPITKSKRLVQFQAGIVLVVAVVLTILSFVILTETRQIAGLDPTLFGWIIRVIILLVAAACVYVAYQGGQNQTYRIEDGHLTITRKTLGVGESSTIVPLNEKTISSVSVERGMIDRLFDTGSVVIAVDGVSGTQTYRIENIDQPEAFVRLLAQPAQ